MIFGKCKLHTTRNGMMQILSKFVTCHMAPHTITHCINDDTSFLRESRDIKYHMLYVLIEY